MYRLKNRELERELDRISDGNFSYRINSGFITKLYDDSGHPVFKVEFGPTVGNSWTRRFALVFEKDEIENTVEDVHADE